MGVSVFNPNTSIYIFHKIPDFLNYAKLIQIDITLHINWLRVGGNCMYADAQRFR